jgi:hypothetical protein
MFGQSLMFGQRLMPGQQLIVADALAGFLLIFC